MFVFKIKLPPSQNEEPKIKLKVSDEPTLAKKAKDLQNTITIKLNMRRTLAGDLMIMDHRLINIYIKPVEHKIMSIPKEEYNDVTYGLQRDFFKHLVNKGIIDKEDIEGGTVYGSLQAIYKDSTNVNQSTLQLVIFAIYKWLEGEKPSQEFNMELFKKNLSQITDPDKVESTDPEDIADLEKEYGLDRRASRQLYNTNNVFPYGGLGYYFEE